MATKKQTKRTLLLGYSYTLRDDGSPGSCNVAIAKRMWRDMETDDPDARPYVAAQWEIYDALQDLGHPVSQYVPDTLVVPPPAFTDEDILGRDALLQSVTKPHSPAENALFRVIQGLPGGSTIHTHLKNDEQFKISKADLAVLLNGLLTDGQERLYREFVGLLDLHDLDRTNKRSLGLEKRRLPDDGPRNHLGLRRFQAKRINRLIVEEILTDTLICRGGNSATKAQVLRRGKYLNVDGVATACLQAIRQSGHAIERIFVYGHPEHRNWCRLRTSEQAAVILGLPVEQVQLGDDSTWSDTELWDAQSAQVWCRSKGNWSYYTKL